MFKLKGKMLSMMLACLMLIGMPLTTQAATKKTETRNPISAVSINITSYVDAGDEDGHVEVTTSDTQYSVGNTDWGTTPKDGWKVGDEPKIKVYLHARSGYYFDKNVTAKKVVVNGATSSTVKKDDDDETLIITIKLDKVRGNLEDPQNAEWVGYPVGKATWEKVENASAYELKLYLDEQPVFSVERCVGTTFDFYPYMTQSGTYNFRVKAIPVSSEESKYITSSDWAYSDTVDITYDDTAHARYNDGSSTSNQVKNPSQVGWVEDKDGWWYRFADGSYPKNAWHEISGKWYYFGYDGYMQTGWQTIAGNTYYLSGNGDMQRGWLEYGRQWYFMNPSSGQMMKGWNLSDGKWFYMDTSTGVMQTGWMTSNGKWYYLDPNHKGAMSTNTTIGGFYLGQDGVWVQ